MKGLLCVQVKGLLCVQVKGLLCEVVIMDVEHVCPTGIACAGGAGQVLMHAMLMEELTTTES